MRTTNPKLLLTPAVFQYSPGLSSGERHGYGIMKQVEVESQGKVNMGAGTLYGSLKRVLDAGLVKESDKRVEPEMDDERRIYYQITGVGKKALAAELKLYKTPRHEGQVHIKVWEATRRRVEGLARERKLLGKYSITIGTLVPRSERDSW